MAKLRDRAIRFVQTDQQVKALTLGENALKPEDRARVRRMIFRDRAFTFAVRPPLEKPKDSGEKQGFGLAAALIEETGQVRFTFTREEARALKAHVISLGANKYVISPGSFVYTANKSYQSPRDICDGV